MARTIGPAAPRSISGNLAAATSMPICRPNPRKTSHGSRKRTLLILSRLPPRSTPTATPARSRTKARSTGEGRILVVPEFDRLLAESPAQVDLPSLAAPGEVDQALLDVAHDDVPVLEPGQFVCRRPGRGEPPGRPGVTPVAACGRGHRRP